MNYIRIQLPRCIIVLTHAELQRLLASDRELWAQALKRGKGLMRYEKQQAREQKETFKGGD